MPEAGEQCDCWQAPSDDGRLHTAAWLGMHERIAVTTGGGRRVEGRPTGPAWFEDEQGEELAGLAVELDDESIFETPVADVQSITPLAAPDPERVLQAIARAVRHPFEIEDGQTGWTIIAGPHEVLEIEVTLRRATCQGHTLGEPPFQFLVRYVQP